MFGTYMKASRYFAMFCNIVCCLSAVCFFKRFERVFLDLSLLRISQWPQQSVFFSACLLLMFWCLEQLSIASKVLAVKFYIVFFDVRFFVSILCLMCKCSVRCVFSGRGRCLLRRDMISCLLCFLIYFFVPRCCFSLLLQSFFWPRGVRLLLFLRLVMGGQTYVVVAVA